MERALVKRLYRDETSLETVMLMEATETKERIKIKVPYQKAGILALEAHGLNDRCPLYSMFSHCVDALGAVFGVAVIRCKKQVRTSGAISVSQGGRTRWVDADVVELVAFALHASIPIYVDRSDSTETQREGSPLRGAEIPSVFETALEDIFASDSGSHPDPVEPSDQGQSER